MPSATTTTCARCNGTGQYHGTRRDGSSYVAPCFACQGYSGPRYRRYGLTAPVACVPVAMPVLPPGQPAPMLGAARGPLALVAFQAVYPAEFAWLQGQSAAGVNFAASLLSGLARYGNLTPRQLAAVQRNLQNVEPIIGHGADDAPVTESQVMAGEPVLISSLIPTPVTTADPNGTPIVTTRNANGAVATMTYGHSPITIDMSQIFTAFDRAAESGLRKVRLTLGTVELKRTGERFHRGAGLVMIYVEGIYRGVVGRDNVFRLRMGGTPLSESTLEVVRNACANPRAAAATHGHDTGYCSCCRRLLTDPPSVMAGIGPVCITRFGWSF